ncbi:unnamed protein product [Amoebophrya sp. A25]|nr:unnamed protein product [Amoebophrya sp. A25]|eukprot:GSA25T00006194001.1
MASSTTASTLQHSSFSSSTYHVPDFELALRQQADEGEPRLRLADETLEAVLASSRRLWDDLLRCGDLWTVTKRLFERVPSVKVESAVLRLLKILHIPVDPAVLSSTEAGPASVPLAGKDQLHHIRMRSPTRSGSSVERTTVKVHPENYSSKEQLLVSVRGTSEDGEDSPEHNWPPLMSDDRSKFPFYRTQEEHLCHDPEKGSGARFLAIFLRALQSLFCDNFVRPTLLLQGDIFPHVVPELMLSSGKIELQTGQLFVERVVIDGVSTWVCSLLQPHRGRSLTIRTLRSLPIWRQGSVVLELQGELCATASTNCTGGSTSAAVSRTAGSPTARSTQKVTRSFASVAIGQSPSTTHLRSPMKSLSPSTSSPKGHHENDFPDQNIRTTRGGGGRGSSLEPPGGPGEQKERDLHAFSRRNLQHRWFLHLEVDYECVDNALHDREQQEGDSGYQGTSSMRSPSSVVHKNPSILNSGLTSRGTDPIIDRLVNEVQKWMGLTNKGHPGTSNPEPSPRSSPSANNALPRQSSYNATSKTLSFSSASSPARLKSQMNQLHGSVLLAVSPAMPSTSGVEATSTLTRSPKHDEAAARTRAKVSRAVRLDTVRRAFVIGETHLSPVRFVGSCAIDVFHLLMQHNARCRTLTASHDALCFARSLRTLGNQFVEGGGGLKDALARFETALKKGLEDLFANCYNVRILLRFEDCLVLSPFAGFNFELPVGSRHRHHVRYALTRGVVGYVARSGQTVNLSDESARRDLHRRNVFMDPEVDGVSHLLPRDTSSAGKGVSLLCGTCSPPFGQDREMIQHFLRTLLRYPQTKLTPLGPSALTISSPLLRPCLPNNAVQLVVEVIGKQPFSQLDKCAFDHVLDSAAVLLDNILLRGASAADEPA